jgi:hypothetical protein
LVQSGKTIFLKTQFLAFQNMRGEKAWFDNDLEDRKEKSKEKVEAGDSLSLSGLIIILLLMAGWG